MSPLGGPNSLLDRAWLDPALSISTAGRLCSGATAKYGYNYVVGWHELKWYKIAVFPPSEDQGNLASLLFDTSQPPGTQGYCLPRWHGWSDAPQGTLFNELPAVDDASVMTYYPGRRSPFLAAGQERESLRLGSGGMPINAISGAISRRTSAGNGSLYKEGDKLTLKTYDQDSLMWGGALLSASGDGKVFMPALQVGRTNSSPISTILAAGIQGTDSHDH